MSRENFKKEFEEIESLIEAHRRFLVIGHVDPDGDCVGSMLAIAQFLLAGGKEVCCFAPGIIPESYMSLPGADLFVSREELDDVDHDMVIALDAPTTARTADVVSPGDDRIVVNIDHHPTNELYGKVNIVDDNAAAVAVLVYRFFVEVAPGSITADMAGCLYLGILMDTGGFRFQNTNAEALETAARLVELGARPYELSHEFIYMNKFNTLKLLSKVLGSLEVHCGGKVAVMEVTTGMLEDVGASMKDTEGFVDYASSIDDIELSAFFREIGPQEVRVSLRSRNDYNVVELAERFGGGGHRMAAGLTVEKDLKTAKSIIIKGLDEMLKDFDHSAT